MRRHNVSVIEIVIVIAIIVLLISMIFMQAQQALEIARVWRVSTVHITEKDSQVLSEIPSLTVYEYPEGFWLTVPEEGELDTEQLMESGLSSAVGHILSVATGHAVEYIMLDRDAPVYDFLSQYHW